MGRSTNGSRIVHASTTGVLTTFVTSSARLPGASARSPPRTAASRMACETRANEFIVLSYSRRHTLGDEPAVWRRRRLRNYPLFLRRGRAPLVWAHCRREGQATTVVATTFR